MFDRTALCWAVAGDEVWEEAAQPVKRAAAEMRRSVFRDFMIVGVAWSFSLSGRENYFSFNDGVSYRK